ncbi:DUF92 domain-containing protein [Halapricum hydrolyticum]|uniref:DUF92 domain-containing protein n=1 Tax=Halapricum hydrolyticum TaxID=2979991 RepID=A0AAE3IC00_9EURY|nr:DUF92 domain-containing protein [Halapricum hydrolyticum]MCU4716646.1 DUF92 domain-containing protein [Halapricum hydrolyticum]MCU4725749.1 DUF92 domain-containing protein [Halapricum hydrolyticum]
MTSTVRRAGAFAGVGVLSLAVPVLDRLFTGPAVTAAAAAPFLAIAVLALVATDDSVIFELFARPGDRRDGRLFGLAGFALAIAGLSLLATQFGMGIPVFVASVVVLSTGNLAAHAARSRGIEPFGAMTAFVTGGFLAGIGGYLAAAAILEIALELPQVVFLAATGSLTGALVRSVLFERDDLVVLLAIGLLLWLFSDLSIDVTATGITAAVAVTVALGYVSYALETASLPGMLTGVLLSLLTLVVGDVGWFAMLITFFGLGGLSSKLRYEQKVKRGIAEPNEGARGSGNVLANSLVALFAVIAHAASSQVTAVPEDLFLFIFAGSVAAAMSDTFSSEIGGLYDNPRLITTLEVVDPGTDGGVTWQGELAGFIGAALIAGIGAAAFDLGTRGVGVVVAAGLVGMTVDSVLGATLEGRLVGNQGVNFLATFSAGLAAGGLAIVSGTVAL